MLKVLKNLSKRGVSDALPMLPVELDIAAIGKLIRFFPIGRRVTYHPEFKQEIALHTIIIGYSINSHMIYSNSDFTIQESSQGEMQASLNEGETTILIDELTEFCFILPTTNRGEAKLSYESKNLLGPHSGFANGNNITLTGEGCDGQIPVTDTTVIRRTLLQTGVYKNNQVVLLGANPKTLTLSDQRTHLRLPTNISGTIKTIEGGASCDCVLMDISDHSARIKFDDTIPLLGAFEAEQEITLDFTLPEKSVPYTLRGKVIRKDNAFAVISLAQILTENRFVKLELIDILEIKSHILQYPVSEQKC